MQLDVYICAPVSALGEELFTSIAHYVQFVKILVGGSIYDFFQRVSNSSLSTGHQLTEVELYKRQPAGRDNFTPQARQGWPQLKHRRDTPHQCTSGHLDWALSSRLRRASSGPYSWVQAQTTTILYDMICSIFNARAGAGYAGSRSSRTWDHALIEHTAAARSI